jgi:hypothetical protein
MNAKGLPADGKAESLEVTEPETCQWGRKRHRPGAVHADQARLHVLLAERASAKRTLGLTMAAGNLLEAAQWIRTIGVIDHEIATLRARIALHGSRAS